MQASHIEDLLDRERFDEASMYCEQCLQQYFPLFGNDWKEPFEDLRKKARVGLRTEEFQRSQEPQSLLSLLD